MIVEDLERPDRCETCRFAQSIYRDSEARSENEVEPYIQCHRNPPLAHGLNIAYWPMVYDSDWCGEWQPLTVGVRKKVGPRQRRIDE